MAEEAAGDCVVTVREFNPETDTAGAEAVETSCEVGPSDKLSLFTDLHGDPISRVRHSPAFLMLVAEMGKDEEIVGLIRGCIKTVTCGKKLSRNAKHGAGDGCDPPNLVPVYTKLAYILGLRVSASHRRMGIGLKLVSRMEQWFRESGAEYSYIATESDNLASVKLFTDKCGYGRFRTPSILVHPVFAHRVKVSRRVTIIKIAPSEAESLYRRRFATTEFFPRDIDSVLNNDLSLGTYVAFPAHAGVWPGSDSFLADPPDSWAVLSVWNCKDVFTLEVRGASRLTRGVARVTRFLDGLLPWLRLPSLPEVFRPFGLHFLYGLGGEGPQAARLMASLCGHAHNLARESACSVVATEVGTREPLRVGIPHWKRLSCAEDLWCMKRLGDDYSDGAVGDWTKSPPGLSIFVDPREF